MFRITALLLVVISVLFPGIAWAPVGRAVVTPSATARPGYVLPGRNVNRGDLEVLDHYVRRAERGFGHQSQFERLVEGSELTESERKFLREYVEMLDSRRETWARDPVLRELYRPLKDELVRLRYAELVQLRRMQANGWNDRILRWHVDPLTGEQRLVVSPDVSGRLAQEMSSTSPGSSSGSPESSKSLNGNPAPGGAALPKDVLSSGVAEGEVSVSVEAETSRLLKVGIVGDRRIESRSIEVPAWDFFGSKGAAIKDGMEAALKDVSDSTSVFFTELPPGTATTDLLPGRITARTFDNSPRFFLEHGRNLQTLFEFRFRPGRAVLFNYVAAPDGAPRRAQERWAGHAKHYSRVASDLGIREETGRVLLLETLREQAVDVVVVAAHGDSLGVYLPGGGSISARDVLELPELRSNARPPIVVLLACRTGSIPLKPMRTIAQALMLKGYASAVIAPTRDVPAGGPTAEFLRQLLHASSDGKMADFVRSMQGPWQVIVDVIRGLRKFFRQDEGLVYS